jgi:hypothetical protein
VSTDDIDYNSPFSLGRTEGGLRLRGFATELRPRMSLSEFQNSDMFPEAKTSDGSERKKYYTLKIKWTNQWVFIGLTFTDSLLSSIGFGWGVLRNGFEEINTTELQEQLLHFKEWLEQVLGPSKAPRQKREAYYQNLAWGEVTAESDPRTELVHVLLTFAK